jgi:hypothetical protein
VRTAGVVDLAAAMLPIAVRPQIEMVLPSAPASFAATVPVVPMMSRGQPRLSAQST